MNKVTYRIEAFRTGETLVSFFNNGALLAQETLSKSAARYAEEFAVGRVADYEWAFA
jgi:hypothetical protein